MSDQIDSNPDANPYTVAAARLAMNALQNVTKTGDVNSGIDPMMEMLGLPIDPVEMCVVAWIDCTARICRWHGSQPTRETIKTVAGTMDLPERESEWIYNIIAARRAMDQDTFYRLLDELDPQDESNDEWVMGVLMGLLAWCAIVCRQEAALRMRVN